jgi:hypothetical protein
LIRAAVWEKQIARTLARHGVPPEIAALPHVESSFNLAAYSKVGAGDTVIVQAAEALGHYADWSKVSSQALRTLNKLHKNAMVTVRT